ncbi:MAG: hypothetical protein PWP23_991 [Candidatus Sumerlaeota bacterium]|nr:hypothetical protein [Candidatus Sumerlaeota bacterium]
MNTAPFSLGHPALFEGRRSRAFHARGFSLIEILVVLAILTIMTGVALFGYSSYRESLVLTTTGSTVQRTLMQARNRAIHLNLPHQAVIDIDANTIWVNQLNSSKTETTPKVVPETSLGDFVRISSLKIGSSTFTSGTHTIAFETDGRNPLVIVNLYRLAGDPAAAQSFTAVRLYPSSGEVQVLDSTKL